MRVLIVAATILACAAASPSGALLAAPYGLGHGLAFGHAATLAVRAPIIPSGDIQGAAIDAHVSATDHVRASYDAARQLWDQGAEWQGKAIDAAVDHSWQAVDAVKTREAQLDGATAGVAPILAKQFVGHGHVAVAPLAYANAAPLAYGALAHGAPLLHGAHLVHGAHAW